MEDRAWLHSAGNKHHINVAELDAVIKGLSLALDWKLKKLTLATDLKTVHGWVTAQLHNLKRVKISGLNEVVVNRRLQIIEEIVALHDMTVNVVWVSSRENLSDCLTCVPSLFQKVWKDILKRKSTGDGLDCDEPTDVCAAAAPRVCLPSPLCLEDVCSDY